MLYVVRSQVGRPLNNMVGNYVFYEIIWKQDICNKWIPILMGWWNPLFVRVLQSLWVHISLLSRDISIDCVDIMDLVRLLIIIARIMSLVYSDKSLWDMDFHVNGVLGGRMMKVLWYDDEDDIIYKLVDSWCICIK